MRGAATLLGLGAVALLSLALVSNSGVGPVSTLDYVAPQPAANFGESAGTGSHERGGVGARQLVVHARE